MLNKTQKTILGVSLLIFIDVTRLTASELTKYLYAEDNFNKPFFCTYFKSSMFTIYLIVIGLIAPWKEQYDKHNAKYTIMDPLSDVDEGIDNDYSAEGTLSDPTFVPIRSSGGGGIHGTLSGTESDDSSIRSVRFSKLAEVREMSAHQATEALMSRLSYAASIRIRRQKTHHKTARIALLFCILWFAAHYCSQLALDLGDQTMVSLMSASSSVFALILAAFFPSSSMDNFSITKCLAVVTNIASAITLTIGDIQDLTFSRGALLALFGAFFYAAYLVFAKRKNETEERLDISLFLGFVGLWTMLLMWPIFFILNYLHIEEFELPNQNQFIVLFFSGLLGTVISEAFWLWGCFLTSSLIGTLAITMLIPLDLLFGRRHYSPTIYLSSISMFLTLLLVAFLLNDKDPLMRIFKLSSRKLCRWEKSVIVRINDEEQQESLIGSSD